MAFFKFRKNSPSRQDAPAPRSEAAAPAETVENLRRRALYRLIGAAVLVLIAIIGFPMLFDTQPRPVAVQAPIVIPDRNAAPPLTLPALAPPTHTVSAPVQPIAPHVPASASLAAGEEMLAASGAGSATGPVAPAAGSPTLPPQQTQQDARAKPPAEKPPTAKQQAAKNAAEKRKADEQAKRQRDQAADAARARALLDGQNAAPAASSGSAAARDAGAHATGRYVIQIGAFASAQSAQTARQKAGQAGVNAYTQTVTTSAGSRTRVRAGPFASRDEAERALAKLKQAGLGGSVVAP